VREDRWRREDGGRREKAHLRQHVQAVLDRHVAGEGRRELPMASYWLPSNNEGQRSAGLSRCPA
jgi:hypothetical protein